MKLFLSAIIVAFSFAANAQSAIRLEVPKTTLSIGDTLPFFVHPESAIELEIAVFSDNKMVFHERSKVSAEKHSFKVPTAGLPEGKYYVLVTGDKIHEQETIQLKSK